MIELSKIAHTFVVRFLKQFASSSTLNKCYWKLLGLCSVLIYSIYRLVAYKSKWSRNRFSLLNFNFDSLKSGLYRVAPPKNGTVDTVDFSGLCSVQQLFFSPYWIEHLFLIIITPRSSNRRLPGRRALVVVFIKNILFEIIAFVVFEWL